MTIDYSYRCKYTGNVFKVRLSNVATINDEPYPPGGTLRVMRNAAGGLLAGPLVEELQSFVIYKGV